MNIFTRPVWHLFSHLFLLSCTLLPAARAQMRVGAGLPDKSAALDVSGGPYSMGSAYRGIAPPKVALTQTTLAAPVASPVTGLLIYNTASVGDVTPGYYYWEGSRWLRFSITNASGARMALGAGQPIPAYTISELRSSNVTADNVIIVDQGREGLFRLDNSDNSSLDNEGAILVNTATTPNKRYKRIIDGPVNVQWFGAKGDDDPNNASAPGNTVAIQAAINFVCAANRIQAPNIADQARPINRGRANWLYIPAGTYRINQSLKIPGALKITGDGGLSYGGSLIYQINAGNHLFQVTDDIDKGNCAVQIEDIRLRAINAASPSSSLFFVDKSIESANSLYFNRVWFQGWDRFALEVQKTDDLQVTNCTFDGGEQYGFALGTAASPGYKVTNAVFSGNTFYGIRGGLGYLVYIDGFSFNNNRVYGADSLYKDRDASQRKTGFGLDALHGCVDVQRVQISNNTFDHVEQIFATRFDGYTFANNVVTNTTSRVIEIGGGASVRYGNITNNIISGIWKKTLNVGAVVPDAPIYGYSTGVRNTVITGNTFVDRGGSTTCLYLPDTRSEFNIIDNVYDGFARKTDDVARPQVNLVRRETFVQGENDMRSTTFTGNVRTVNAPTGTYSLYPGSYAGSPDDSRTWSMVINHSANNGIRRVLDITDANDPRVKYAGSVVSDDGNSFSGWSQIITPATLANLSLPALTVNATTPVAVTNTATSDYLPLLTLLAPNNTTNSATGNFSQFTFGVASSQKNAADFRFYYAGSSSNDNRVDFGFNGIGPGALSYNGSGNVLMGTTVDQASSRFTVASSTQGSLPAPRMTTAQRNAINAPTEGLQIYNLTTHALEFFNGSVWKTVATN